MLAEFVTPRPVRRGRWATKVNFRGMPGSEPPIKGGVATAGLVMNECPILRSGMGYPHVSYWVEADRAVVFPI